MKLLKNEEKIVELTSYKLLLTNKRVLKYGDSYASIPHNHISMIKLDFNHNTNYIFYTILFIILGVITYFSYPSYMFISIIIATLFLVQYYYSRYYSIKICSTGGESIISKISGSQKKTVLNFIYRVEEVVQ